MRLQLDPAIVARIRGNLAVGPAPQHGLPSSVTAERLYALGSPSEPSPRRAATPGRGTRRTAPGSGWRHRDDAAGLSPYGGR